MAYNQLTELRFYTNARPSFVPHWHTTSKNCSRLMRPLYFYFTIFIGPQGCYSYFIISC